MAQKVVLILVESNGVCFEKNKIGTIAQSFLGPLCLFENYVSTTEISIKALKRAMMVLVCSYHGLFCGGGGRHYGKSGIYYSFRLTKKFQFLLRIVLQYGRETHRKYY